MRKIFLVFALIFMTASVVLPQESDQEPLNIKDSLISLVRNTAFGGLFPRSEKEIADAQVKAEKSKQEKYQTKLNDIKVKSVPIWQNLIMICVGLLLVYLAIAKGFEPLLLIPIGMGGILANIPIANIAALPVVEIMNGIPVTISSGGFLGQIYTFGIESGLFPLFIFIGVGAMTDFGPLIANPKTALLGAAAQIGIFGTLLGAMIISTYIPVISFSLKDAASIGIIGGADGPTAIFTASRLSPHLLGAIAVAAYSYMALVPIIQPPIMKWLTTENERKIEMKQLRPESFSLLLL